MRPPQLCADLRAFLAARVDSLDVGTTVGLLAGYGRGEDLEHYARCRGDHEAVVEHLIARGDARRALEVRRTVPARCSPAQAALRAAVWQVYIACAMFQHTVGIVG